MGGGVSRWLEVSTCVWLLINLCHVVPILQEGDLLFRLKTIAFSSLSKLLCSGQPKCSFMSQKDRTDLLK